MAPYFNISGDPGRSIDEQKLMMHASHYLPINDSRVPTGEIAPVAGTPFDFREPKSLRVPPPSTHPQITLAGGFDHCWVLDQKTPVAAELHSPASGVRMSIRSNLPGLQVYGAYHLRTLTRAGMPSASSPRISRMRPITRIFPSSILRPGQTHQSFMKFSFSV